MLRKSWIGCLAGLFILVITGQSRADLVISIGSPTVAVGGTGAVEVDVTNTGNSAVSINDYAIQLVIAPTAGTLTQLAFSAPTTQQLGYLMDSSAVPGYVFLGNSADAVSPPFIGGPGQSVYDNDTFNASDSTADGNIVTIAAGRTYLLAVLPVTTLTQLNPQAGDSFTVTLVPHSGDGSINTSFLTYFNVLDLDSNSPTYLEELSATPYSSTVGTVTIAPASVPEPSSIVIALTTMLIGAGISGARRLRRRA